MSERQREMMREAVAAIASDAKTFGKHWMIERVAFRCQQEWQGGVSREQWWPVSEERLHAMIHEAFAPMRAAVVRWADANDAARRANLLLGVKDEGADREYREAGDALMRLARGESCTSNVVDAK